MRLPPFAPVLARRGDDGGNEVQIGLAEPVVLTGLGLDERSFLASLEGGRAVTSLERSRFANVLAELARAKALAADDKAASTVAIHGCGGLGVTIATALGAAGAAVRLYDDAPVRSEPPGTFPADATGTCAGAAAIALSARGVDARVGGSAAIAVLVFTGTPHPVLYRELLHDGAPHVLAACGEDGVLVSHVVVPGLTACARCRDVALTRADPAWPFLAMQLAGSRLPSRRPRAPGLSGPAAAVRAAMRVAPWLESGETGVAETASPSGAVTITPITPEPECGCGAAGAMGDEVAARRARWRG